MQSSLEALAFLTLAAVITVFSIMTVITGHILRAATYLLFVLLATAGLYFLLGYTFLGAVQVMVYAGGIVVLYVFSILLTSGEGDRAEKLRTGKLVAGLCASIGGTVVALLITLKHNFVESISTGIHETDIKSIGLSLLSSQKYGYLLPFEAVSILLLACVIGGLLIARKR
jgi:NADH-quinone oxidoreductase subunit J